MLKAAGIIMIMTSCSLLGFEFAARLKRRRENLEDIKRGIAMREVFSIPFSTPTRTMIVESSIKIEKQRIKDAGDAKNESKKLFEVVASAALSPNR